MPINLLSKQSLVVYLFALVSFAVFPQIVKTNTAQYVTLNSIEYGFSVSYPEHLEAREVFDFIKPDTKYGIYFFDQKSAEEESKNDYEHAAPIFSILVVDNDDLSIKNWISKKLDTAFIREIEKIKIGHKDVFRVWQEGEVDHYVFVFSEGKLIFLISTPLYRENDQDYERIINSFTLYNP